MEIPYEEFSVLGAIVGSYLFGIGIVLAGGCATGTWYRAGEGLLGSWGCTILLYDKCSSYEIRISCSFESINSQAMGN